MNQFSEVLRAPRGWMIPALFLGFCLAVGMAMSLSPAIGLGMGVAVCGATLALALPGFGSRLFLGGMTFILGGYAFAGRSFAYLGAAPVFIGEIVLALGLLALLLDSRRTVSFRSPLVWVVVAFILWGVATTIPHYAAYRMMSLRDAVLWGYAIFALALIPVLVRNRTIASVPDVYGKVLPFFVLWAPVAVLINQTLGDALPLIPGSRVPIFDVKYGDVNVHLGGAAAFLLLGLSERRGATAPGPGMALSRAFLWTVWLAAFAMAGVINRGGMLAAIAAIGVVMMFAPGAVARRLAMLGAVGFILVSGLLLSNMEIRLSERRPLSAEQFVENFSTIFASEGGQRDGTREWRLLWWGQIVDYTVFGPYRWSGKGYGINLADSDGFQVTADGSLRSPHNSHMTVLARGGVPAFALWLVIQLGFVFLMLRHYHRSRAAGDERMARLGVWLLAYWAAFVVNASFDVALEGPMGGIWFWSIIGMGVAASIVGPKLPPEGQPGPPSGPYAAKRHGFQHGLAYGSKNIT